MKRSSLFFLVLGLSLAGCWKSDHEEMDHSSHGSGTEDMSVGELSGDSIYHLEASWQTKEGKTISLKDLGGKPQVVAMVYSGCEYVCPRIIADMKKIESRLGSKKDKVRFVLASFDTKRDKPARLKTYSKKMKIDQSNWTFLTSSEDAVLELAAVLGVKFKQLPDGEFSHSNVISILDKQGVPVFQQVGLNQDPENTMTYLNKLLN